MKNFVGITDDEKMAYWLEMLIDSGIIKVEQMTALMNEADKTLI
jgi:hypothetical protein